MIRARRHAPVALKRRMLWPGLGFTLYDLMNESGREDCDPKDVACVMRNGERTTAVQDLWMSQYMKDPNTANLAAPSIQLTLDNSEAEVARFKDNQPLTDEAISVVGGPAYSVAQLERTPFYQPAFTSNDPGPKAPVKATTPSTTPQGQVIVNSSGAQQPGAAAPSGGFDLSGKLMGLPIWAWALGGGAALFAFGGGRGR